jgi:hypothetical protein
MRDTGSRRLAGVTRFEMLTDGHLVPLRQRIPDV